jgi:acetyl-CoA carboxylase carboxyltransferase component
MMLTPSQRVAALIDRDSELEIAAMAKSQQPAATGTPRDGVRTAFATIGGQRAVVLAEDPAALARTDGEVARRKRHRILTLATMTQSPIVLVLDGALERRPVFAENAGELAGRMADPRIDIDLERRRAPLVSVVCGPVVGWARDVVAASDVVIATDESIAAGSDLVASMVDFVVADDATAMQSTREVLSLIGPDDRGRDGSRFSPAPLEGAADEFDEALMTDPTRVVDLLVDDRSFVSGRRPSDSGLVTGIGRIGGWPVVVAVTGGHDPAQLTPDDLARLRRAHLVASRANLPLVIVQDCAGLTPDAAADFAGRSALTSAIRSCTAPVISVVSGAGHTLGTFPLGTKQLGAAFIVAWPWARLAITDAPDYTSDSLDAIRRPDPWLAAGRGLVDDVLTPAETVHTVRQLVALFGERWRPVPPADRPNAVIV